jgi:broad specificity phosphatase PhoE
VFSSPLGRATQTAHHLDRPLVQDERLIERSFGRFEGCQKIELTREGKLGLSLLHPNEPDSKPPGGESMGDAARRARSFLDTARDQPERVIAAVTHGQILQALLASIENNDLYEKYRHRNGAYAMIRWIGQEPQIARWNVADHLTVAKLHAQPCPDHTELRS